MLSYSLNLNASESLANESQWNTSQTAYDALGMPYEIQTLFRKIGANKWSYQVIAHNFNNSEDRKAKRTIISSLFAGISGITSTHATVLEQGTLAFNSMGILVAVDVTQGSSNFRCDFGQAVGSTNRVTQFGGNFTVESLEQDGHPAGILSALNIKKDGRLSAYFSNGIVRDVYKIPVAIFSNERGLKLVSSTKDIYSETQESGRASIGEARSAGRAAIKSFALEEKYFIPNLHDFSQQAFVNSTRPTDIAIEGNGFFMVSDPLDGSTYYTRTGSYQQNSDHKLALTDGGYTLQGYSIDESGKTASSLSDIEFNAFSHPLATTTLHYSLNLDPNTSTPRSVFNGESFANAEATSNYNLSTIIYDSLGNARNIVTYFRKEDANAWSYHLLTEGRNIANYSRDSYGTVVLDEGLLLFRTNGSLDTVTSHKGDTSKIQWADGASPVDALIYDFGQIAESKFVTTQYPGISSMTQFEQDGRTVGALNQIEVATNGRISATFSNGAKRDIYEIPLASFINVEGLKPIEDNDNLYIPTIASGNPAIGAASTFDRGKIRSYALELNAIH
jgi:flagellar hook protein FlgE